MKVDELLQANPNKFFQDLCGLNKKHKLELKNPTLDEVKSWFTK
jgi:lysyl-tRNA synthetase class 2